MHKQIVPAPDGSPDFSRSAPEFSGSGSAMSGIPLQPNGGGKSQEPWPAPPFPPLGSGCGGGSLAFGPLGDRLDSHSPCQHRSAAVPPQRVGAAPPRQLPEYRPTASCHGSGPQLLPPPGECPDPRSTGSVWCPSYHGPWDWPQSPPPKGALVMAPSTLCQVHSRPKRSSQMVKASAQSFSKTPALTH